MAILDKTGSGVNRLAYRYQALSEVRAPMADWLFDRGGRARILHDSDKLRNNQGRVIAWISGNNVYSLRGRHVGWFEGGVLFDSRNCPIAFARNRTMGLPSVPGIGGTPGMPGFAGGPGRPGFGGVPARPGRGGWSQHDVEEYFGA